jgi:hypothetical protein
MSSKIVTEGKIESWIKVRERRGRNKQLLGDIKEKRTYRKLKHEALDCTTWINIFGRVCEPVLRRT